MELNEILKSIPHTIIDVRSEEEYNGGHIADAINIPIEKIPESFDKIKQMPQPVILCCESGSLSRTAHIHLSQKGFANTYNGGSWLELNALKNNNQ